MLLGSDVFRCTDSGSDNDAKEAHALHFELVSRGAVQKLTWLRMRPKHSHNYADRVNSMVKEVMHPKSGSGGGCCAPWDMEDIVKKAVKSQNCAVEFGWQWCNLDWKARYKDHFHSNFAGYGEERLWIYEYDPTLPPLYVKVTYQTDLLVHGGDGSREPAMRPVENVNVRACTLPNATIILNLTLVCHYARPCDLCSPL